MRLGQQLKAEPYCNFKLVPFKIAGFVVYFTIENYCVKKTKRKLKIGMYCCYPILTISKTFFINHNTQSKVAISFYKKKKKTFVMKLAPFLENV